MAPVNHLGQGAPRECLGARSLSGSVSDCVADVDHPCAPAPLSADPRANGVNVDFADKAGEITTQHYAFLVSEPEFDAIIGRIKGRGLQYWADPARSKPGAINRNDGGRGIYFPDPSGHLLEIITRPYGGGGQL